MAKKLRLSANNIDDLTVLSAVLQDATIKIGDMTYLPEANRFACVTNRFYWEGIGGKEIRPPKRVRSGFHFDGVLGVAYRNLPMDDLNHVLELLAINVEEGETGTISATLVFSGFAALRLELECIDASLEDLSQPWRAIRRPDHNLDE
jgi:hypothetical protein